MLFSEIANQIKTEARVSGDDTWDQTVYSLISECFKEAVEAQRPFELRKSVQIPLQTGVAIYALPQDFFIHHQFFFEDADTGEDWQLSDGDVAISPAPIGFYGHPKDFQVINGQQVLVEPKGAIVTGDNLRVVYYLFPPVVTLANANTANPIPRLEPFLIRAAIRRVRLFHSDDLSALQALSGDIASAAKGYTNDGPEAPGKSQRG